MRNIYLCGIDIGTSKCVASLARVAKDRLEDFYVEDIPSQGIKDGVITDLSSFSNCLHNLLEKLENKSKTKITNVYIGMFGPYINSKDTSAVIPLAEQGNKVITSSDVRRVNEQARNLGLSWDKEIIHQIPQGYTVDTSDGILNPLGLYAHSLAVKLYLITSPISYIDNFIKAISQAGYNAEEIIISSLAINFAITKENQDYILIDFGEDFTRILVFNKGILNNIEILDFGGSDLTQSVSSALNISLDLAKEIKEKYAVIGSGGISQNQEVMIKKSSEYCAIKRKFICEAVESKLAPFLGVLKEKIEKKIQDKTTPPQILFSGGTVLLEGFLETAESIIGIPLKITTLKENIFNSANKDVYYAGSFGLLYYGLASHQKNKVQSLMPASIFKRIIHQIRELYLDYF